MFSILLKCAKKKELRRMENQIVLNKKNKKFELPMSFGQPLLDSLFI
jgi:hypothetical protein